MEVQQSTLLITRGLTEEELHHLGLAAKGASKGAARLAARYGRAENRLRASGRVPGYRRSR